MQILTTPAPEYSINLAKSKDTPTRTSGYHLSSILRHIALRTGILDEEYDRGPSIDALIRTTPLDQVGTNQTLMRIVIGYAVEDYLKKQLAQTVPCFIPSPGETLWDGIYGTPDALEVDDTGTVIVHEFKSTSKTSTRPIYEELLWMWQIMGYLYMLSQETGDTLTTAVLHPIYLNGDYRTNRHPIHRPMRLTFDPKDLETNWRMIMDNKYQVMPEVW